MEVVKLNKKEHKELIADIYRLCFAAPFTSESFQYYLNCDDLWEFVWGVFDHGLLVSSYIAYEGAVKARQVPFRVNYFDGFVTRPGYRNRGLGRLMFENQRKVAAEKGIRLFALDPFKNAYYRKFGFEDALDALRIKIPMRNLSRQKEPGLYRMEVRAAYNSEIAEKAVRESVQREWEEGFYNPMKIPESYFTGTFKNKEWKICILRDGEETVQGVLLYSIKDRDLTVYRMSFFDLKAILTYREFLSQFRDQVDTIKFFKAPPDFPLDLFADSYHSGSSRLEVRHYPTRMMQILDIGFVLEKLLRKGQRAPFSFTIRFIDPLIEQNNQTLHLSNKEIREQPDALPDIEIAVRDFVPVMTGKSSVSELFAKGKARVPGCDNPPWNRDKYPSVIRELDAVFPPMITHNCEYCF